MPPLLTTLPTTGRGGKFVTQHHPPYRVGNTARLTCGRGYKVPNYPVSSVKLVRGRAVWVPPEIHCEPVTQLYLLPETSTGGSLKVSRSTPPYHLGDTAQLVCEPGYTPPSKTKATVVLEKGRLVWKPDKLMCTAVPCPKPFIPVNGKVSDPVFRYPHSFRYECREGYRLNRTADFYHCTVSGKWLPTPPSYVACIKFVDCPVLTPPQNGYIMGPYLRKVGSLVKLRCNHGYFKSKGDQTRVCQEDGTWSGEDMVCEKEPAKPCEPMDPKLVKVDNPDKSVKVFCDHGRTVTVRCLPSGEWSIPPPYCHVLPPVPQPASPVQQPAIASPAGISPTQQPRAPKPSNPFYVWVWIGLILGFVLGLWTYVTRLSK